jgi:hypothetical protein
MTMANGSLGSMLWRSSLALRAGPRSARFGRRGKVKPADLPHNGQVLPSFTVDSLAFARRRNVDVEFEEGHVFFVGSLSKPL